MPCDRHITADVVAADMDDARKMQKRVMGCNNPPELVERFKCALSNFSFFVALSGFSIFVKVLLMR